MGAFSLQRKGKELWLNGMMVADCANEGVAATLQLAVNRARIKPAEAEVMLAVFGGHP